MCEVSSMEVPLGMKNDVDWIARRGKWSLWTKMEAEVIITVVWR